MDRLEREEEEESRSVATICMLSRHGLYGKGAASHWPPTSPCCIKGQNRSGALPHTGDGDPLLAIRRTPDLLLIILPLLLFEGDIAKPRRSGEDGSGVSMMHLLMRAADRSSAGGGARAAFVEKLERFCCRSAVLQGLFMAARHSSIWAASQSALTLSSKVQDVLGLVVAILSRFDAAHEVVMEQPSVVLMLDTESQSSPPIWSDKFLQVVEGNDKCWRGSGRTFGR